MRQKKRKEKKRAHSELTRTSWSAVKCSTTELYARWWTTREAKTSFLLHVNTRYDTCSSLADLASGRASCHSTRTENKREWASTCVHNQNSKRPPKLSAAARCWSSFTATPWVFTLTSIATHTVRESVVTPMHVWHVRTTTPTHSHSTHELYLQLCTFYFWPYRILTLPYTHSLFITMFFILAFILILVLVASWQPTNLWSLREDVLPGIRTSLEWSSPSTLVTRRRDRHSVREFETSNQSIDFFFFFFSLLFNHGYSQIEHRSHCWRRRTIRTVRGNAPATSSRGSQPSCTPSFGREREAPSLLAYRSAIMVRPGWGTVSDTEHHERGDKILARRWHAGAKICKRGPRSSFGTPSIEPVHCPEDAACCSPDSECAPASSTAALWRAAWWQKALPVSASPAAPAGRREDWQVNFDWAVFAAIASQCPDGARHCLVALLEEQAKLADNILDISSPSVVSPSISAVADRPASACVPTEVEKLRADIAALRVEVANLSRSRSRSRSHSRGRSHSNTRGRSASPNRSGLCYYHERFGSDARKCRQPCSFSPPSGNGPASQ